MQTKNTHTAAWTLVWRDCRLCRPFTLFLYWVLDLQLDLLHRSRRRNWIRGWLRHWHPYRKRGGLEEVKTVVGCLCLQRQTERRRDKREVQGKDWSMSCWYRQQPTEAITGMWRGRVRQNTQRRWNLHAWHGLLRFAGVYPPVVFVGSRAAHGRARRPPGPSQEPQPLLLPKLQSGKANGKRPSWKPFKVRLLSFVTIAFISHTCERSSSS